MPRSAKLHRPCCPPRRARVCRSWPSIPPRTRISADCGVVSTVTGLPRKRRSPKVYAPSLAPMLHSDKTMLRLEPDRATSTRDRCGCPGNLSYPRVTHNCCIGLNKDCGRKMKNVAIAVLAVLATFARASDRVIRAGAVPRHHQWDSGSWGKYLDSDVIFR